MRYSIYSFDCDFSEEIYLGSGAMHQEKELPRRPLPVRSENSSKMIGITFVGYIWLGVMDNLPLFMWISTTETFAV